MDEFDTKMNEIFDKEYYNKELNEDELDTLNARQEKHLQLEEQELNDDDNNDGDDNDINNDQLWFYCDECKKPLKEGKIKYECKTCDNYTLCKKCFKKKGHEHQMKKDIIPSGCNPPANAEDLIKKVEAEEEDNILKCSRCNKIIVENRYYICNEDSCKDLKFCKDCRGLGKIIHEHKLIKYIIKEESNNSDDDNEKAKTKKDKLKELIDEKANYNIDDVIDKQLGTKFHYTKVAKEDSGLTDDMLLLLDDKILNKYLPLKKITAYNDYKMPEYKKKIMLNRLEKLVNKKNKELANEYEAKYKNEKENEKLLLGQKTKGEHNNEENKKKEMLYRLEKLVNKKKRELAEEYENRNKNEKYNEKFLIGQKTKGEHDDIKEKDIKNKNKDKYKNKYIKNKNKNDKNKGNNAGEEKKFLSKEEFKKQKRLETYGISE